jgi:hypothetical protein
VLSIDSSVTRDAISVESAHTGISEKKIDCNKSHELAIEVGHLVRSSWCDYHEALALCVATRFKSACARMNLGLLEANLHLELGGDEGQGEADDEEGGEADGDGHLAGGARGERHCNGQILGQYPVILGDFDEALLTRLEGAIVEAEQSMATFTKVRIEIPSHLLLQ